MSCMEALQREIKLQDERLSSFLPPEEISKYRVTILLQEQEQKHQQTDFAGSIIQQKEEVLTSS